MTFWLRKRTQANEEWKDIIYTGSDAPEFQARKQEWTDMALDLARQVTRAASLHASGAYQRVGLFGELALWRPKEPPKEGNNDINHRE